MEHLSGVIDRHKIVVCRCHLLAVLTTVSISLAALAHVAVNLNIRIILTALFMSFQSWN